MIRKTGGKAKRIQIAWVNSLVVVVYVGLDPERVNGMVEALESRRRDKRNNREGIKATILTG